MSQKHIIVIGAGLGGLATALRLSSRGYRVTVLEKNNLPGGRLHLLEKDGFTFDMGPSFFSMSYEFEELFKDCGVPNPLPLEPLDPVYSVFFSHKEHPYHIYKDIKKLAHEFRDTEPDFEKRAFRYLSAAKKLFHDTENVVIRKNFEGRLDYLMKLTRVPLVHGPKLFRTMWAELERHFTSEEVKIIFSLVAFFLGSTPFQTPAVYSLLNYTELWHDGYWNVRGGMYTIVTEIMKLLHVRNVEFHFNTEIVSVQSDGERITAVTDQHGNSWHADAFVCNSDAAFFRGKVLNRNAFREEKLDQMDWSLAPFTIYLGVKGKIPTLAHHTYFLGNNFRSYADKIFTSSVVPDKPYYYVNVSSRSNPDCAPEGCENIFILVPVPDRRYKPDWNDSEQIADQVLADLSERCGFDLKANTLTRTVYHPGIWEEKFNLYKGSGLGLAHGLNQIGGFRPSNRDEELSNLFYVGASTVPGTGLPIVVISSKLVTERIEASYATATV